MEKIVFTIARIFLAGAVSMSILFCHLPQTYAAATSGSSRTLISHPEKGPSVNKPPSAVLRLYKALRNGYVDEDDLFPMLDDDSNVQKRQQYDDYGHMRFGKRAKEFDDYGHLRFGK